MDAKTMKFVTQDYYEILNLGPGATDEEVKRAYRMVKRSFRPDSMAVHSLYSAEETEAISAKIDEAFRMLSGSESSRRYARYHRTGRVGMSIPTDPDEFFDKVHALEAPAPIVELARQVGFGEEDSMEAEFDESLGHLPVDCRAPATDEIEALMSVGSDLGASSEASVASAEVFIDTLEELGDDGAVIASHEQASVSRIEPSRRSADSAARPRQGVAARRASRPAALRGARAPVSSPRPAGPQTMTPRASSAVPKSMTQSKEWLADEVRTRGMGPLEIAELPREDLEALEMDCGGVNGQFIQAVRRRVGISLRDIADRTKIGIGMLRAIEADDIDHFPARVYMKGYLTQVCRLLCLPVPQVPERYLTLLGL